MKTPPGYILWQGNSLHDGAPIVVIATLESRNDKTGNMVQVTIIRTDIHPVQAIREGKDYSICGDCGHRGVEQPDGTFIDRSCYVLVDKSVAAIYRAFLRGSYIPITPEGVRMIRESRETRWGNYGDPCLIPELVVATLTPKKSRGKSSHTGYIHQWRDPQFAWCKTYFMASCDSLEDYNLAVSMGWTPFLVLPEGEDPPVGMIACPAVKETAKDERPVQCITCMACSGSPLQPKPTKRPPGRWIRAHGRGAKKFAANSIKRRLSRVAK